MEYWLAWFGQRGDDAVAVARAAEQLGYTGVALPDHVAIPRHYDALHPTGRKAIAFDAPYPDALISIAAMAAATRTLRFMTYVYILPMRDPFTVAKQVATLDILSGQRFAFGTGAGWNTDEIQLLGHAPATRGRRMDEMLAIMQDLWHDGVAQYHGDFYDFAPVGQFPVPARPIPVWIGGTSPAALARAARHDGWLGMHYPPAETRALLARLEQCRRQHLDAGGDDRGWRRFVLSDEVPAPAHCRQLEDLGIDGLVIRAWPITDARYGALAPKLDAMAELAAGLGLG